MLLAAFISGCATTQGAKEAKAKQRQEEMQKKFAWWGQTGATPAPVKDEKRSGYWWWPTKKPEQTQAQSQVWGNGGYVYLIKIFNYKDEPAQAGELKPSLLIKKIIKNVKIYFEYDRSRIQADAKPILDDAVAALQKSPETSILISGNCDVRGSEKYNDKLGRKRAESVKKYMIEQGISEDRIKIVSRGKLDAVAPVTDLKGMAKDRNAQFMVAVVEEVMLPTPADQAGKGSVPAAPAVPGVPAAPEVAPAPVVVPADAKIEEGKYVVESKEEVESTTKVETKEYTVRKGDTLWTIAQAQLGSGHRWKTLAEMNKDTVKNPNKLKPGQKIIIPIE
ncbi:MAG: OmpA family protein [Deltaproteobacteria bacterium]